MQKVDLVVDQGADFSISLAVTDTAGNPVNMDGYSANSGMRKSYSSTSFIPLDVELSNGEITISLSGSASAALQYGRFVWDVLLTNITGQTIRPFGGVAFVSPGVSSQGTTVSNQPDDGSA